MREGRVAYVLIERAGGLEASLQRRERVGARAKLIREPRLLHRLGHFDRRSRQRFGVDRYRFVVDHAAPLALA